ncbi:pollen-specific leucine-rich repeat extensin-like protein 1 [Panicum virgatum]|uniref:pollen-specific leucine-rich repeat extensin-like protein 1 n=1 Tax=Panicum virgatum TaxID=38727 RepID=UPI0019D51B25|nr:pollen-specific leucine-rich repeat extensin-like protein 1 [Panicum virgatum]
MHPSAASPSASTAPPGFALGRVSLREHGAAEAETPSPQEEIPSPQEMIPSPQEEMIPSPQEEPPSPQEETIPSPQEEMIPSPQEEPPSPQEETIPSPQEETTPWPQAEIPWPQAEIPWPQAETTWKLGPLLLYHSIMSLKSCANLRWIVLLSGDKPFFTIVLSKGHVEKPAQLVCIECKKLGPGWRDFVVANRLRIGDACVFELITPVAGGTGSEGDGKVVFRV